MNEYVINLYDNKCVEIYSNYLIVYKWGDWPEVQDHATEISAYESYNKNSWLF